MARIVRLASPATSAAPSMARAGETPPHVLVRLLRGGGGGGGAPAGGGGGGGGGGIPWSGPGVTLRALRVRTPF